MKVQFMLEFKHELIDEEKLRNLKVVETYSDPETWGMGYDILEAEVLGIWEIKIRMGDGKVYIAEEADQFRDGDEMKWYVTIWSEFEEE